MTPGSFAARCGRNLRAAFVACALLAISCGQAVAGDLHRVVLDGAFEDWDGLAPTWVDPTGDGGPSGFDVGNIWLANDEERLFLAFEVGGNLVINEDNQFTLYIDTDDNPATGYPLGFIGAELVWNFGDRAGFFFHSGGWIDIAWDDIELLCGPTHSSTIYELSIARDAVPGGVQPLFGGGPMRIVLRDQQGGGDWAPDMGGAIAYTFADGTLPPLETIDLVREAGPMRIVSYNVLQDRLFEYYPKQSFRRVLQALEPDVIAFQEIYDHTATETRLLVEEWLGGDWDAYKISDKVLVTRTDILAHYEIAGGRAAAYRVAPMGDLNADLLIINVHLSCCSADEQRQEQCDAIMAFIRDAKEPGGLIDLAPENPILIIGDTNFVGLDRQLETLLTGDIFDNATYGPDFAPDWDDSDLVDLYSRQPTEPLGYTWYKPWSDYWPARIDMLIYTDSNLSMAKSAILQTEVMPEWYRLEYGLEPDDTSNASDHLPHFADLTVAGTGVAEQLGPASQGWRLRRVDGGPGAAPVRLALDLPEESAPVAARELRVAVHDLTGRLLRRLDAREQRATRFEIVWDGTDEQGRPISPGTYWVRAASGAGSATARVLVVH